MLKLILLIAAFLPALFPARAEPLLLEPRTGAEKLALARKAADGDGKAGARRALALLKGLEDEVPELDRYVFFVRGEAMLAAGKRGAAEMFLLAAEAKALETEALERAAAAFEKRGKRRRAAEIYRTLIKSGDGEKTDFYLKKSAQLAEKNGEKTSAVRLWKRLWRDWPLSDFSDLAAQKAAALGDGDFPLRSDLEGRADVLFKKRKWKSALAAYRELPPGGRRDARMAAGIYRTGRKNPAGLKEALSLLEGVKSAEGLHAAGVILEAMAGIESDKAEKTGKLHRARDAFRSVHRKFPGSREAGKSLVREQKIALKTGAVVEAEEIYSIIKDRYPSRRAGAGWRAGWAYYRAGDYGEAERIFSENSRGKNSFLSGQFEYWTARIVEKRGDTEAARRMFEKVARGAFSYYSFLASGRLAPQRFASQRIAPQRAEIKPSATVPPPPDGDGGEEAEGVRRARLLSGAGLERWAKAEAYLAAAKSPLAACAVLAGLGDFSFCIKLAGNNPPDGRLRLAFPRGFEREVKAHSGRNGLEERLVYSLIREESRFASEAVSVANAFGLMQLIMPTAREVAAGEGVEVKSREDLFEPALNIRLGTRYLGRMLERFEGDIPAALAAYNAGPSRARRWKEGALNGLEPDEFTESVPFDETRNYIRRIFRSYGAYTAIYGGGK